MYGLGILLGYLATGTLGVLQEVHPDKTICVKACWSFVYTKVNPKDYPSYTDFEVLTAGTCLPELDLQSVLNCSLKFCSGEAVNPRFDYFKSAPCDAAEAGPGVVSGTVDVTAEDFELSLRSVMAFDRQQIYNHSFGWAIYLMLGVALMIGITHRFVAFIIFKTCPSLESRLEANSDCMRNSKPGTLNLLHRYWQKYVALPAFFGYRSADPWGLCSIPTRAQSIYLFVYVFLNLLFSFAFYSEVFQGNLYFKDETTQRYRYLGMRTGIIGMYNLVLAFALSGRNNLMLWMTGWSFSTLNLFHRWAARISILQAVVHSIVYIQFQYANAFGKPSGVVGALTELYYQMGVMSTLALMCIVPLTIRPLRKKWYETFLILHIITVTLALVGFWYHLQFFGTAWLAFGWACVGLWAGDRAIRFVKLGLLSSRAFAGKANSLATLQRQGEMVRLEVVTSLLFHPKPGTHCFIYFPVMRLFWENHPFTLASWAPATSVAHDGKKRMKLTFLVSQHAGMTRALARKVAASDGVAKLRVLVEGPYGQHFPVHRYQTVCLVAGGSGITNTLSYLCYLRKLAAADDKTLSTRRVEIVWIAKDQDFIDGILQNEFTNLVGLAGRNFDIRIMIYLTRQPFTAIEKVEGATSAPSPTTPSGYSLMKGDSPSMNGLAKGSNHAQSRLHGSPTPSPQAGADDDLIEGAIEVEKGIEKLTHSSTSPIIRYGRPAISTIVCECLSNNVSGRTALLLCGPRTMKDDMRKALADGYDHLDNLKQGYVEYFEATFAW